MKSACLLALPALLAAAPAHAGAWTEDEGHWQVITGGMSSQASGIFGGASGCDALGFGKSLLQNDVDYGLRAGITVFANTEAAWARSCYTGGKWVTSTAVEAGARLRLLDDGNGVLSLSGSYKSAGAFNFSDSSFSRAAASSSSSSS